MGTNFISSLSWRHTWNSTVSRPTLYVSPNLFYFGSVRLLYSHLFKKSFVLSHHSKVSFVSLLRTVIFSQTHTRCRTLRYHFNKKKNNWTRLPQFYYLFVNKVLEWYLFNTTIIRLRKLRRERGSYTVSSGENKATWGKANENFNTVIFER